MGFQTNQAQSTKRNADSVHPPSDWVPVTASDTTVLPITRALWIGVGGNLVVTNPAGVVRTIPNVPNGYWVGQVTQVRAATTATSILAVY